MKMSRSIVPIRLMMQYQRRVNVACFGAEIRRSRTNHVPKPRRIAGDYELLRALLRRTRYDVRLQMASCRWAGELQWRTLRHRLHGTRYEKSPDRLDTAQ